MVRKWREKNNLKANPTLAIKTFIFFQPNLLLFHFPQLLVFDIPSSHPYYSPLPSIRDLRVGMILLHI